MSRSKPVRTSALYFPDRLMERLAGMRDAGTTIVEAPSGYGKTTATRAFLERSLPEATPTIWFVAMDEPPPSAWRRFCRAVESIDERAGRELSLYGLPDADTKGDVAGFLRDMRCDVDTYLVVDDFHHIEGMLPAEVWSALVSHASRRLHVILLTQLLHDLALVAHMHADILYIDGDDLRLRQEEIAGYFRAVGLDLRDDEVAEAHRRTEGWMVALYLQMLSYVQTGTFTRTSGIRRLLRQIIWDRLDDERRDLCLRLCVFDRFTVRQAAFLLGVPELPPYAVDLLETNPFLRYDAQGRAYFPHSTFLEFVRELFDGMADDRRYAYWMRAAECCVRDGQIVRAAGIYYRLREYERIAALDLLGLEIAQADEPGHVRMLLDVAAAVGDDLIARSPLSVIKLAFELFGAGQYEAFGAACGRIAGVVAASDMPQRDKRRLLGELTLLESFQEYNDIRRMSRKQRQAYDMLGAQPSVVTPQDAWTFGNASVLFAYHARAGHLDEELADMDECLPYYSALVSGHGAGADALMRAEAHLNRGALDEAEVQAHAALYAASERGQACIEIGAALVLCRLAILRGDGAAATAWRERMSRCAESLPKKSNRMENDIAQSYVSLLLGRPEEIAEWLQRGDITQDRLFALAIPYAQVQLGRFLLAVGRSEVWLGMAEGAMGFAQQLHYAMAQIEMRILAACAHAQRHGRDAALAMLRQALALALPDRLYLPFAECWEDIASLLEEACPRAHVEGMRALARLLAAGREAIARDVYGDAAGDYGLTEREWETIRLAAQGLSNPAIADRLYVSRNTVKTHLKSAFAKLGVSSREELRAFV